MSDKASKEMENNSNNDIDNLQDAEGLDAISENIDNLQEIQGSKLMSEVLEAVNSSRSDLSENESKVFQSEDDAIEGAASLISEKDSQIEKLQQEIAAAQDKYLRSLADFENYKKRALKERSEMIKYQGEQIVLDMVRVFDDLELAVQFSEQDKDKAVDPQTFVEGLKMIHKNFVDALSKWDIRSESAVGKPFDPQKHMAISKIVLADSEPGTVVSELKKVYFYKDKILRVAEVIVSATDQ